MHAYVATWENHPFCCTGYIILDVRQNEKGFAHRALYAYIIHMIIEPLTPDSCLSLIFYTID